MDLVWIFLFKKEALVGAKDAWYTLGDASLTFSLQYGSEVEELQQHRTADKEVQQQLRSEVCTMSSQ